MGRARRIVEPLLSSQFMLLSTSSSSLELLVAVPTVARVGVVVGAGSGDYVIVGMTVRGVGEGCRCRWCPSLFFFLWWHWYTKSGSAVSSRSCWILSPETGAPQLAQVLFFGRNDDQRETHGEARGGFAGYK